MKPSILCAAGLLAAVLALPVPARSADAPPGATSCSGCHALKPGVEGALPKLNGRNPTEVTAAMQAFKSGQRPSTVMNRIAKGFSDKEIVAIAEWLSAQP